MVHSILETFIRFVTVYPKLASEVSSFRSSVYMISALYVPGAQKGEVYLKSINRKKDV